MKLGRYHTLRVVKEVDFGVYLDADGNEILLPAAYVPEGTQPDDELEVFLYRDSEERPIATTLRPYAIVGECAYMEVKQVTRVGAFLDWGIAKDLLVPFSEQPFKLMEEMLVLAYVFHDERTDRIAATCQLNKFINNKEITVAEGDAVELVIGEETELGHRVVINHKHWGMLYFNEIFKEIHLGDRVEGFVKKLREDGKIDVALQKQGYAEVRDASEILYDKIKENDGVLLLTDKSEPEAIYDELQMSKKTFKKALGAVYKARRVSIDDRGIYLA
jgi:uncharacterized protein